MSEVVTRNELPEGWIEVPLADCVDILDSQRVPLNSKQRADRIEGKLKSELYPYYGATGAVGFIDDFIFEGEHLLLGEDAAPFFDKSKTVAYIANGKFWVNNHAHILNARSSITSNKYLLHYLNRFNYTGYVNGTTRLKLNQGNLKTIPVPLASLEQQKRIVARIEELFSHIDAGIAALKKAKQLLKQYRQSVLKAAITGELTKQWREDNKASLEGWQQSSIGEIAVVQTGKTPKRSNPEFWDNGDIPWLTSSATNNAYTHHADQFVTQAAVDGGLKMFGSGTLLLAMYGEGKTRGQVTEITFRATCNQACAAIIVDEDRASKAYVRIRLLENYEETRKAASGGNQPNLNLSKVRDISLPLPILAEQSEIVSEVGKKFDGIERLARDLDAQLLKAEKNKQSILASAFSGKI